MRGAPRRGARGRRAGRARLRHGDASGQRGGGPVVGLIAHLDTSPDAPGSGVEPIVHEDYDGGVIELPRNGTVLDPSRLPELAGRAGTTSSPRAATPCSAPTTSPASRRSWRPSRTSPHTPTSRGRRCACAFTPDEEVGEGASLFDLDRFGADFAYTLDGSSLGSCRTRRSRPPRSTSHRRRRRPPRPSRRAGSSTRADSRAHPRRAAVRPLTPETRPDARGSSTPTRCPATRRGDARVHRPDFDDDVLPERVELLRHAAEEIMATSRGRGWLRRAARSTRTWRVHLDGVPGGGDGGGGGDPRGGDEPIRTPSAAARTGRCSARRGCRRPTSSRAGTSSTPCGSGCPCRTWPLPRPSVVRLAGIWAGPLADGPAGRP